MIPVYICDDLKRELQLITKVVSNAIKLHDLQGRVEIACADQNPNIILERIKSSPRPGIYFLDVDLGKGVMSGLKLGEEIRRLDPVGIMVMVTTHAEAAAETYRLRLQAEDFILKDYPEEMRLRIAECVLSGFNKLSSVEGDRTIIYFGVNNKRFGIPIDQICYVRADSNRKLFIRQLNTFSVANSTLSDALKLFGYANFYQCNKSHVVNLHHVIMIDYENKELRVKGGDVIEISVRCVPFLKKYFSELVI